MKMLAMLGRDGQPIQGQNADLIYYVCMAMSAYQTQTVTFGEIRTVTAFTVTQMLGKAFLKDINGNHAPLREGDVRDGLSLNTFDIYSETDGRICLEIHGRG